MKQDSPPRKPKFDDAMAFADRGDGVSVAAAAALNDNANAPSLADIHPFLRAKITPAMSKNELLSLLADFRAKGVRSKANDRRIVSKKVSAAAAAAAYAEQHHQQQNDDSDPQKVDCLDPFHLQQLCVLFSSYCPTSANAPNFCVPPW